MKCGRKGSVFSVEPSKFSGALKTWWYNLQPNQRGDGGPRHPEVPIPLVSWALLAKSGRNGVFLGILALSWWRHALAKLPGDESKPPSVQDWERLVYDVDWVLTSIHNSRGTTTGAQTPSNSPSAQQLAHDSNAARGLVCSPKDVSERPGRTRGKQLKRRVAGSEDHTERRKRTRR